MVRENSVGVKFKITLSQEEFEILKEYAELQDRPMAGAFMDFVREANTFSVLKKVNSAGRKIQKLKLLFRGQNEEVSASIT